MNVELIRRLFRKEQFEAFTKKYMEKGRLPKRLTIPLSMNSKQIVYPYTGQDLGTLFYEDWSDLMENMPRYAKHVFDGIVTLHTHGIIHGNVCPESITVLDGQARLGDYSKSRLFSIFASPAEPDQYSSLSIHQGRMPRYSDDLVSLGFTFLCLIAPHILWFDRDAELQDKLDFMHRRFDIEALYDHSAAPTLTALHSFQAYMKLCSDYGRED